MTIARVAPFSDTGYSRRSVPRSVCLPVKRRDHRQAGEAALAGRSLPNFGQTSGQASSDSHERLQTLTSGSRNQTRSNRRSADDIGLQFEVGFER